MAKSSDPADVATRRLRVEENQGSEKTSTGSLIPSWVGFIPTPDKAVWAEITEISGREFFNIAQVQSDVDTRIRIRNYSGQTITPDMRGVEVGGTLNGTVYNFRSVRTAEDDRSVLEIMAVKVVTNPRT